MISPLELPAGRELDAKVAEALELPMAWQAEELRYYAADKPPICSVIGEPTSLVECEERCARLNREPSRHFKPVAVVPPYSTNIASAWEIVDVLLSRRLYPDLISSNYPVVWSCEVDSYSDPETDVDPWPVKAWADTAPIAICRAALMAVRARADASE